MKSPMSKYFTKIQWLRLLFFLLFFLLGAGIPSYSQVKPIQTIMLQNNTYQCKQLKYPPFLIDGIFYYPMTWELSRAIGVKTQFDQNGLHLSLGTSPIPITSRTILSNDTSPKSLPSTLESPNFPIFLDEHVLSIDNPIYVIDHITYLPIEQFQGITPPSFHVDTFPKKYSTFDHLDPHLFIRDQEETNTCWAFATNSLFEIKIATQEGSICNFSEDHMINHAPIPSTYESGGYFLSSFAYYLNQTGPVPEISAPFGSHTASVSPEQIEYVATAYATTSSIQEIKQAIMEHGATLTSIYLGAPEEHLYTPQHHAYYNHLPNTLPNHGLVLVGWDDAYPRTNFNHHPTKDGAFLAMHSAIDIMGQNNFFYISYEDPHVTSVTYNITNYEHHTKDAPLFYNQTGVTHYESIDHQTSAVISNHFIQPPHSTLTAIGFFTPPLDCHISFYCTPKRLTTLPETPTVQIYSTKEGYQKILLPEPMDASVFQGSWWITAYIQSDAPFIIPLEAPYPNMNHPMKNPTQKGFVSCYGKTLSWRPVESLRTNASLGIRAYHQPINPDNNSTDTIIKNK